MVRAFLFHCSWQDRGRDDDRFHEFSHEGRSSGRTTAWVFLPTSVLGVSGPKHTKFVNLWMEQAIYDDEDSRCMPAVPDNAKHLLGVEEIEDAKRAIVREAHLDCDYECSCWNGNTQVDSEICRAVCM